LSKQQLHPSAYNFPTPCQWAFPKIKGNAALGQGIKWIIPEGRFRSHFGRAQQGEDFIGKAGLPEASVVSLKFVE
jgi:hypothetical protein